jgi:sugar phosphate isomerase/epimerase
MGHLISCRSGTFGALEVALPTLANCGLRHAEVDLSADGDYARVRAIADAAGVRIATLSAGVDLDHADSCAALRRAIDGASVAGTRLIFCSIKSAAPLTGPPLAALRQLLDHAAAHAVTLAMETHPPYGTNAGTALQTIDAVNHPHLRYNFDTANLYYYNHGLNAVDQLRYCRHIVASVHLKDTFGQYHDAGFPILGQGVVDFPRLFALLDEVGFAGPCTLELEGGPLDAHPAGRVDFLQRCLAYLREIGAMA